MRPGVMFDALFALQNLDHRLAACGITTFCHAVSFADSELGLRSATEAERLARLLSLFNSAAVDRNYLPAAGSAATTPAAAIAG